ncbi:PST family polysaccharide transporter [Friedmanniella endophytica]|uniref:PST family polysaccharide transporter n=1 Tax=Microlunatus kandeliicorticis TaxID=1759536 RepID=A0A7W3P4A2_9ACTN|nr:lipopolysaccharide biosynthesis protein [Microlunatus kandeliicorticis]MBA8792704.1 PST family polysaccharide transporter [Microlunatus kandeliicorticis]
MSTATPTELAQRAGQAFGWSFLNTVGSRLGTLAIGIALARLLGPAEFGTFAVATVAMLAMLSFNELGVSLAVVRWRDDPATIVPTVNTISTVSSTVLLLVVLATAPAFATAMGDPGATDVVRLMSVAILINGAVATPAALMQREFQQRRRLIVDQLNAWLGAGVSLLLAWLGFGAMSLAVGRITGALVSAVLFLIWSPLPYRFGFDRAVARRLLGFGLPLAGSSMIVFAVGYADQLVAGSVLGATALGFYVLAFNLSSWPVSIFSQPLRSVAPAAFARLQDDRPRMASTFRAVLGVLSAVTFPVCLVLVGAAGPVVGFVYGSRWLPAAEALVALGALAVCRILFELSYDFLVVLGRTSSILAVQGLWLVVLVPALVLGARLGGISGVAVAQLLVAAWIVLPCYGALLHRNGVRVGAVVRVLVLPVAVGLAVAGLAWMIAGAVPGRLLACLLAGLGALAGVAILLVLRRDTLATYRRMRSVQVTGVEPA